MLKLNFVFTALLVGFFTVAFMPLVSGHHHGTIIIAGHIEDGGKLPVIVQADLEVTRDSTDIDGNFHITFEHHRPDYFSVRIGRNVASLFLIPGDSIFLRAQADDFTTTMSASGDRSAEASYLHERNAILRKYQTHQWREFYKLPFEDYVNRIDSVRRELEQLHRALVRQRNVDDLFLMLEATYTAYKVPHWNVLYPMYHPHAAGLEEDEEVNFPVEEANMMFRSLPNSDARFLIFPVFRDVIKHQYNMAVDELREADSTFVKIPFFWMHALDIIGPQVFPEPEVREYLRFDHLSSYLTHMGPGHVDELYHEFLESTENEYYANRLRAVMQEWAHIMPGKSVPDFAFTDLDSNVVHLSDLHGKIVYMDVWATWCGPCLAEHPHWDELYGELMDDDVVFLTVSIDAKREPWEKMVREKDMKGVHWYAEGAWEAEMARYFNINGIPRFILLNRNGTVLEPSAERPSGGIKSKLVKYLSE